MKRYRKVLSSGDYVVSPDAWDYVGYLEGCGVQKRRGGNPGTSKKRMLIDCTAAFDIETTRYGEGQSFMYIWMLQLGEGNPTIIGRTWEEFSKVLDGIVAQFAGRNMTLCVWVHNLSYEFQFLREIYDFKPEEVFAVKSRRVLRCSMYDGVIEFRCSYLHSNMSLDEYTAKMGAGHGKLSGVVYDYAKKRYPWTVLDDYEMRYCVNDVLGLVESLNIEMAHDDDTLYTVPLTSTGYVRRDAKKAMRGVSHEWLRDMQPSYGVYCLLSEAFRGGNTHANRWFSGKIVEDVRSVDESSAYPAAMLTGKYPVSRFEHYGPCDGSELLELIGRREKAVLARVGIHNVALRDETWGCPYLSISKCRNMTGCDPDNGRVLSAEYLETTVTDIDLRIVADEYNFSDIVCEDCYVASYGELPDVFKGLIIDYFERKTKLKGVPGEEVYYVKSKNKLNSLYGMTAQDPVKRNVIFNGIDFECEEGDEAGILAEYTRKSFFPYQWGVWVTANARMMLEDGLKNVGMGFVYCDTDSVKYVGDVDFCGINDERMRAAEDCGAYADDPAGNRHYMGVFESDGVYSRFRTWGAKKYAYEQGGALAVTVAGVSKKPVVNERGEVEQAGAYELRRSGGLEAFRPGFCFSLAGGAESVYNDESFGVVDIDGHFLRIGPNVCIRESTYMLGLAGEYERLLERVYRLEVGESEETTIWDSGFRDNEKE